MALKAIIIAINRHPNPKMRMGTQPVTNQRFRFRTDGIRYLEQSRHNPMTIEVVSCFK